MDQNGLSQIIEDLKNLLIDVSVRRKFNLQHPEVQQISRTLDGYILEYMKCKQQQATKYPPSQALSE